MSSATIYIYISLLFVFIFPYSLTYSTTPTYVAAVIEHVPIFSFNNVTKDEARKIMNSNLDVYEEKLKQLNLQLHQPNIVVYPEDGIYGSYFTSRDSIFPYLEDLPEETNILICNNSLYSHSPIFQRVSCLAKNYGMAIVFNMGDVQFCHQTSPNCPKDGRFQYNTQVAFDEHGKFLAKYHKSHLFGEVQFDEPPHSDPVTFTTSFGVTFGMMICFDIMFQEPLHSYLEQGINNIVFSSWWVNFPPLITATQAQQANSLIFSMNILASGIGMNMYSSGSGIYSKGNALSSFFNPNMTSQEQILIAEVPIFKNNEDNTNQNINKKNNDPTNAIKYDGIFKHSNNRLTDPIEPAVSVFVPSSNQLKGTLSVSYNDSFECHASYELMNNQSFTNQIYGLVAYKGSYVSLKSVEICAIVSCSSSKTCSDFELSSGTYFSSITVKGSFTQENNRLLPLIATDQGQLIDDRLFQFDSPMGVLSLESANSKILNACLFNLLY